MTAQARCRMDYWSLAFFFLSSAIFSSSNSSRVSRSMTASFVG